MELYQRWSYYQRELYQRWSVDRLRGGDSCRNYVRLEMPVLSVMPWCRCCSKMCLHALEKALIWSVATYQELWPISVEWYMLVSWYMLLVSWIYSNNLLWYNRDIIYILQRIGNKTCKQRKDGIHVSGCVETLEVWPAWSYDVWIYIGAENMLNTSVELIHWDCNIAWYIALNTSDIDWYIALNTSVELIHWDCNTAWYIALNTITSVRNAAWRGDDVFLDCTNPRLSLCGDIAACAWRLCCVKQAAICLEIYAGDCVCILCWWSCKDYIGDHSGWLSSWRPSKDCMLENCMLPVTALMIMKSCLISSLVKVKTGAHSS